MIIIVCNYFFKSDKCLNCKFINGISLLTFIENQYDNKSHNNYEE